MFNAKGSLAPNAFDAAYRELRQRLVASGCRDWGPVVIPPDDYDRLRGAIPNVHVFVDRNIDAVHFKLGMDGVIFQRGY